MMKYTEITAKLLSDAAVFFTNTGENNAPLKEQMEDSANAYNQLAELIVADPYKEIDGANIIQISAKMLTNAAQFFRSVGETNPEYTTQMNENADLFEQMAELLINDPEGTIDVDKLDDGGLKNSFNRNS